MKCTLNNSGCMKACAFVFFILLFDFFLINGDYIAADPYSQPDKGVLTITENQTVSVKLNPSSYTLHAIALSIIPATKETSEETKISLLENNINIWETEIKNYGQFALTGPDSIGTSFEFGDIVVHPNSNYELVLSSTTDNKDYALGVSTDQNGVVWNRLTYLWISRQMLLIVVILIELLLGVGLYYVLKRNREIKPEQLFFLISIPLCIGFISLIPVFGAPDELSQFVRALSITNGEWLVPENGCVEIPIGMVPLDEWHYTPYVLWKNFSMQSDFPDQTTLFNIVNMAVYMPLCNFFISAGIWISKLWSNNTYLLMFGSRLANAIGCTAMIYYAIRKMPYAKYILVFISLLPMNIHERCSVSTDGITYAALVVLFAFCMSLRESQERMTKIQLAVLYGMVILLASCKLVYFVLCAIVLIVPIRAYGTKLRAYLHRVILAMITLGLSLGWFVYATSFLGGTRAGGNTKEKVYFILSEPLKYLDLLNTTIWEDGILYIKTMIGSRLGRVNISVSEWLIISIIIIGILIACFDQKMERNCNVKTSYLIPYLAAFATLLLIFTSLFIQWTVGNPEEIAKIEGIQGRYFLPILPIILCLIPQNMGINGRRGGGCVYYVYGLYFINILTLLTIWMSCSY